MPRKRKIQATQPEAPLVNSENDKLEVDALAELTAHANRELNAVPTPKDLSPGATERFNEIYNSIDLHDAKEFSEMELEVLEMSSDEVPEPIGEAQDSTPYELPYSTLLEFYQARSTVASAALDIIPEMYVEMEPGTNIIRYINFAFMIPFDVIKGSVDYCILKKDGEIRRDYILGIPSRYDIIDNGNTVQAYFHVDGTYDVKSMFDPTYTVLRSSLSNNRKMGN